MSLLYHIVHTMASTYLEVGQRNNTHTTTNESRVALSTVGLFRIALL